MNEETFKQRTRMLGIRVIAVVRQMPRDLAGDVLARQLVRSATSDGASYRAACRAKSPADMLAMLAIVEEESDETGHWLEMLRDSGTISSGDANPLIREANRSRR